MKKEAAKTRSLKMIQVYTQFILDAEKYDIPDMAERSKNNIKKIRSRFFKKYGTELQF